MAPVGMGKLAAVSVTPMEDHTLSAVTFTTKITTPSFTSEIVGKGVLYVAGPVFTIPGGIALYAQWRKRREEKLVKTDDRPRILIP